MLCAAGDRNLFGFITEPVFFGEFFTNLLAQLQNADRGGIAGLSAVDSAMCSFADRFWSRKVRFAGTKANHVLAFSNHFLGKAVNGNCQGSGNIQCSIGETFGHFLFFAFAGFCSCLESLQLTKTL